jgi:uncharacterized protein YecE (DUF72 family)
MANLYAGTSGFAYPSWKPAFYPATLPSRRFLSYYAGRLNAVEINYTFSRLPTARAVAAWIDATPPGFLFAPKAHMRITHTRRLKDAAEATRAFLNAIEPLRAHGRLGPILFQLPPNLKADTALLRDYLASLPRGLRYAFEFRHGSWLTDETYEILRRRNVSLCLAESGKLEIPPVVTADFVYFRLRKPSYSRRELGDVTRRASESVASGRDVFTMFKHEDAPSGALCAEWLLKRARQRAIIGSSGKSPHGAI